MMNLKKIVAMAVVGCSVFVLSSCGDDPGVTTTDNSSQTDVPVTTTESIGSTDFETELKNYNGYDFTILSAGNVAYDDFSYDEASSVALDNAMYQRQQKVESDYHVNIDSIVQKAYSVGNGPGYQKISQAVLGGDCFYDAALVAGYDVSVLAYNDMLYDMNSISTLHLEKAWWDQQANRELAINDLMFFTTGDITNQDNDSVFTLVFNKKLFEDYQLEDPYALVKENKWTLENFGKLTKAVGQDLNHDDKRDENDLFGLLVWDDAIMGIINASGEKCATVQENGEIVLSLYNERTVSLLEQYFDIIFDENSAFCYQRHIKTGADMWNNNQALFWMTAMANIPAMRTMEADFGILPYPKMTAEQDSYHNTISPYNSQFYCVPLIQNDVEMTGTILEALAYYGYTIVKPAYYDKTLVGQSTRDDESSEMLDIIFSTLSFDFGYYYQVGSFNSQLIFMVREYDRNFTSRYNTYKTEAETKLDTINTFFKQVISKWN